MRQTKQLFRKPCSNDDSTQPILIPQHFSSGSWVVLQRGSARDVHIELPRGMSLHIYNREVKRNREAGLSAQCAKRAAIGSGALFIAHHSVSDDDVRIPVKVAA